MDPASARHLGPQPDPAVFDHGITIFTTELRKIGNTPAIKQGNETNKALQETTALLNTIKSDIDKLSDHVDTSLQNTKRSLKGSMRTMNHQLSTRINDLSEKLDTLTAGQKASRWNNYARSKNSPINSAEEPIVPLKSVSDCAEMPGFPTTVAEVRNIGRDDLDRILLALDCPTYNDGSLEGDRKDLLNMCGITLLRP